MSSTRKAPSDGGGIVYSTGIGERCLNCHFGSAQDGQFVGWFADGSAGTFATAAGVGLGTTRQDLEQAYAVEVFESTRDQVRRALEAAGIVLLSTDKGEGVLLLHDRIDAQR